MKPRVLVICTGNSMRSQMAEGLLRADLGDRIIVHSAGIRPTYVDPDIVAVLKEIGIDISGHRSKSVSEFLDTPLELVVTVCESAAELCPAFPLAKKTVHKGYPVPVDTGDSVDPHGYLRDLRDRMRVEMRDLVVKELGL